MSPKAPVEWVDCRDLGDLANWMFEEGDDDGTGELVFEVDEEGSLLR
jgi:hypothetical protein